MLDKRNGADMALLDAAAAAMDGMVFQSRAAVVQQDECVADVLLRARRAVFHLHTADDAARRVLGHRDAPGRDPDHRELRLLQHLYDRAVHSAAGRCIFRKADAAKSFALSAATSDSPAAVRRAGSRDRIN